MCTAWPGDAHTWLLGAGSFVALIMVARLIALARDLLGWFEKLLDMADWVRYRLQG